jgi:Zn-dependent protease with chaperone function
MPTGARYYDGEKAVVQDVAVRPTSHELVIYRPADSGIVARWPIAELAVLGDLAHEAAPPVVRRGGDARLIVEDAGLRGQLAGWAPALSPLVRAPIPLPQRLAGFTTALVGLVALFWFAVDYGTEFVAPLLPYSLQAKLGDSVFDELTADKDECHGRQGLAAINGLANRLAEAADYGHPVTVHVIKGGPVNAYTLPGGVLVFYSDLIEQAKDGSQVAGVLAHEIGHVVHYHPTKGLVRQYGVSLIGKLLGGGYSDIADTMTSGGNLLWALHNGRAFEREADATGVALLDKLGLRADGVSSFFEQMMKQEPKDSAAALGIWSSHPPTAERIAATKRPPSGKPPFTDAEWRALRNVCK